MEACISKILFSFVAFLFFMTILFGILTIRTRLTDGLSTNYLIEDFGSETDSKTQIRGLIQTIGDAEDKIDNLCSAKATEIQYTMYSLSINLIFLICYTISIII